MAIWKTDPLYRLVFREVEAFWVRLHLEDNPRNGTPPEGFRVEEHLSADWGERPLSPTLKDVWGFDQFGIRLFPGLRRFPHDPGERRGAFWQFALVRFHVAADRSHVALYYDFGPGRDGSIGYDVQGNGDHVELMIEEGSLSGSF